MFWNCNVCGAANLTKVKETHSCSNCGAHHTLTMVFTKYLQLIPAKRPCRHHWVDARNEAVVSGEVCTKCNKLRASKEANSDRG